MAGDLASEVCFWLFVILIILRYTKLIVGIFTYLLYRAVPITDSTLATDEATVVIPTTFRDPLKLLSTLLSIQNCRPAQIMIVTAFAHTNEARELCSKHLTKEFQVFGVEKLGKRRQIVTALQHVQTSIVVFADDDVLWPSGCLQNLLAIFDDDMVGAGGPCQRVTRPVNLTIWSFLGICYLERRVWNNITTQAIDGSISTLSGRTAAYRTALLKNEHFYDYFLNDSFLGNILDSDDDKCLTRHIFRNGYKIKLQRAVSIETTMEAGSNYLNQCKRWSRAHWRGNFTVMLQEKYWASLRHCWGVYAIYFSQFLTPTIVVDALLFFLYARSLTTDVDRERNLVHLSVWILCAKVIRLVPYFYRYPQDVVFIPVAILFGWFHGLLNIYALTTLRVTNWGTQPIEELEKPGRIIGSVARLSVSELAHDESGVLTDTVHSGQHSRASTPHEKEQ